MGRTGTLSLKGALEQLLGGACYHMLEVMAHPEHVPLWHRAVHGDMPDWNAIFGDYVATVDWPSGAFWRELADAYPSAVIVLSVRENADAWWRSASQTIFEATARVQPAEAAADAWHAMVLDMMRLRFTENWQDEAAAKGAYERHNDLVRSTAPADRLVEWVPSDGWGPLCAALDLSVPDAPFPHVNTTAEFRAMTGLDAPTDSG